VALSAFTIKRRSVSVNPYKGVVCAVTFDFFGLLMLAVMGEVRVRTESEVH
jgi:hypothetical protein